MALRIGLEGRQIDDREFGDEVFQFGRDRPDQQLADEQRVPGQFGEDPRPDPVFRIGAAVEVLREQFLAARMRDEVLIEQVEVRPGELAVAIPPDGILGQRIDDGVLVLRRAAGVHAGLRADRTALHDVGLARRDRMFVELRRFQVPVDLGQILETEFVGAVSAVPHTRFLHERPPATDWPDPPWMPQSLEWRGWAEYSPLKASVL